MHRYQEEILALLSESAELQFADFKHYFDISSNKLSYHLNQVQEHGFIEKEAGKYRLTPAGKEIAPYLGHEQLPLPVVLVAPIKEEEVLLVKREKEAYKGMYALPSTTMAFGEPPETVIASLQEKYRLQLADTTYRKTVVEIDTALDNGREHHFLFLLYTATPQNKPGGMKYFPLHTITEEDAVIPTDAAMITHRDKDTLQTLRMDIRSDKPRLQNRDAKDTA